MGEADLVRPGDRRGDVDEMTATLETADRLTSGPGNDAILFFSLPIVKKSKVAFVISGFLSGFVGKKSPRTTSC